jgi:uncharacterized membrane protein
MKVISSILSSLQGEFMKSLLVTSLLLVASVSQADVIKCSFTEPFVDSVYSMTQSTLTYSTVDERGEVKNVIKNVSFQIKEAGVFQLVAKNGDVLQALKLSHQGSNGMSDAVYPYEVQDNSGFAGHGIGGCSSNYQKAVEPKN